MINVVAINGAMSFLRIPGQSPPVMSAGTTARFTRWWWAPSRA